MAENAIHGGTADMPLPKIMNYSDQFKITPLFIRDLETVLGDLPYIEAKRYIDTVKANDSVMHASVLNEFITSLQSLPYRVILPLMRALSIQENFNKYFEKIVPQNNVPAIPTR